jgi:lipopolysaccharide export system permease protein
VYGRISADNEILAVLASGVPPMRVVGPTLILSFLLSLFAVWLNDIAFSWGRPGINRVVMHSLEQVAYGYLSSQGSYTSSQGFSIHVHGIGPDGRELIMPTITPPQASDSEPTCITAKSARLIMDPVKEMLRIELIDGEMSYGEMVMARPGLSQYEIQLSDATRKGTSVGHPTEYAMRQISYEMTKQREEMSQTEQILAARTAMGLAIGKYEWLDDARTHAALGTLSLGNSRLNRLNSEPWRRWASGFSCFFFVWVGIPLAIWMRSADHWTSFGTCFMPILLIYYPIFAIGLNHAKDGSWLPISVWMGNAALLLVGAWWMRRINRG